MKRVYLIISGYVQGVGFRWYAKRTAKKFGITGRVRNLRSGEVEILAEGEEKEINKFLNEIRSGSFQENIEDVKVTEGEYKGQFSHFSIRFF